MVACEHGNADIVSRLLQIPGLDPDYQNEIYCYSAAHVAIGDSTGRSPECLEILAKNESVDLNKKDLFGRTSLGYALWQYYGSDDEEDGIEEIVQILLNCPRVDLNLVDPRQLTKFLFECCDDDNPALLSRLVKVPGLDLNYCEKYGNTAAIKACSGGNTECVKILE